MEKKYIEGFPPECDDYANSKELTLFCLSHYVCIIPRRNWKKYGESDYEGVSQLYKCLRHTVLQSTVSTDYGVKIVLKWFALLALFN